MEPLPALPQRFSKDIKGVIECFDRVVLFGSYKAIGWPGAMEQHLWDKRVKLLDYTESYANELRLRMAQQVRREAARCGVTIKQVNHGERKEAIVEAILGKRGRKPGVVCILGAMEGCRTFKVGKNQKAGRLALQWSPGKCQHFYIYFIDDELGLCYLRIPTWAPFRLQAYCNGHDWLERRMTKAGIRFRKADNCFTHISDFEAAQKLAQEFAPARVHAIFSRAASRWVAVDKDFGHSLHWSIWQAEWATDIVFKNDKVLPDLYRQITRTAACEVGCADIYRFLGKRRTVRSKAEASSRLQTLVQGTRLKHSLGSTSIKMYDKAESVLRIECTTSDVKSFTHYRKVEPRQPSAARQTVRRTARRASTTSQSPGAGASPRADQAGSVVTGKAACAASQYAPMRKTLYSLPALSEAMRAVNQRYLAHISQWQDRTKERHDLRAMTASVRDERDNSHRGINFFREEDVAFMQALQRGEHHIRGLRNRGVQQHLPGWSAAKIGRALRRFRAHGLLKKIAGTHKYYLTRRGSSSLVAAHQLKERLVLPALAA